MSDKFELAQYLVNLNTLIDAQGSSGVNLPSAVLAEEYNRNWDNLKNLITKEKADEARNRNEPIRRSETGTEHPRGKPGSGRSDR